MGGGAMLATFLAAYGMVHAPAATQGEDRPAPPPEFVLPPFRLDPPCPDGEGEEIVVCGRRDDDRYRLREPIAPRGMTLPRGLPTRFSLGGGAEGEVDVTQNVRADGWVDQRIVVHVRVPF